MDMELVCLAGRPPNWDQEIKRFSNKTLFHESAWLDYARSTQPRGEIQYFEIRRGSQCMGYFCCVSAKKFGLVFWGSPFPGGGMYMGPIFEPHIDQAEMLHLLNKHCKAMNISYIELCNDWLDAATMQKAGFRVQKSVTHVCPLKGGVATVWARMKGTCRTRIRKAEKSGLEVERVEDSGIVEDFYSQFTKCLSRKGLKVPYPSNQVHSLFHHLWRAGRLFALRVRFEGRVVATGFYPYDDRVMYHWNSAYEPDFLQFSPNELMYWTAMKMAIERGIATFNIGGGQPSRFEQKFGGSLQPYLIYRKSFVPFLEQVRHVYHFSVLSKLARSFKPGI